MQRAQCGERIYDATDLEQLPDGEREALKPALTCVTCGVKATFRRRARNGRAANYSAQHREGCKEDSRREDAEVPGDLEEVPAIWNDGKELVLRRDKPAGGIVVDGTSTGSSSRPGKTHVSGRGEQRTHARSIGLAMLLLRLRTEPELSRSDRVLILHDGSRTTIADACSPASRFRYLEGKQQILWGIISEASVSGRNLWLNTGERTSDRPAVLVRARHVDEVLDATGTTDVASLRGQWFIVEGSFKVTVNGAPYVTIDEAAALHIAQP